VAGFTFSGLLGSISPSLRRAFTIRFDKSPIASLDALIAFVETRAAYVAQTSLYGYLKTRMGTRYRYIFEDTTYAASINFAKWRIYAACLEDLAIFAAGTAVKDSAVTAESAAALARHLFERAVDTTFEDVDDPELRGTVLSVLDARLPSVDWDTAADGENAFAASPRALVTYAPIADELKSLDTDIVTYSIRFRWRDVRDQLRKRIDGAAIRAAWPGDTVLPQTTAESTA